MRLDSYHADRAWPARARPRDHRLPPTVWGASAGYQIQGEEIVIEDGQDFAGSPAREAPRMLESVAQISVALSAHALMGLRLIESVNVVLTP